MFSHPARAVASYSSGPPAAGTVGTKSTGGFLNSSVSPSTSLMGNYFFVQEIFPKNSTKFESSNSSCVKHILSYSTFYLPPDFQKCLAEKEHLINNKKVNVKKAREDFERTVFIHGGVQVGSKLNFSDLTDGEILEALSRYGRVTTMVFTFDNARNPRKGMGYITFERKDAIRKLCAALK